MITKFLTALRGYFSHDLLIEINPDKILIQTVGTTDQFEYRALVALQTLDICRAKVIVCWGDNARTHAASDVEIIAPFDHPRNIIHHMPVAAKLIQAGIKHVHNNKVLRPSPRIIFNITNKLEGGLSQVEEELLKQLATATEARDYFVHVGAKPDVENHSFKSLREQLNA